ncbi:unnamed protein product [Ceratitis capitata]|uniref:(Mediterranean fruit fly) hypothetical protein n=1 Tax=Ceratitis capitata TaxID=7213 RepID=A0A811U848_CERCA|nr:unnamed protein product [Ceratitis capitata]
MDDRRICENSAKRKRVAWLLVYNNYNKNIINNNNNNNKAQNTYIYNTKYAKYRIQQQQKQKQVSTKKTTTKTETETGPNYAHHCKQPVIWTLSCNTLTPSPERCTPYGRAVIAQLELVAT